MQDKTKKDSFVMEQIHEKVKSDLLAFGKRNGACKEQYQRLYKASTIEEVVAVVKDNFWWCARYRDFADMIISHREIFGEHQIFANQDIDISEGIAYLLATEGEINAKSYDASTINATSYDASTINAKSRGTSTINAKSWDTSTINAKSRGTSTINATSFHTSTINAESCDTSTINATSYDTSTINATSLDTSTINAKSFYTSTINATSLDTSTIIIRTSTIECKVNDQGIARYVHDNRIVVADDSIKVEIVKE